MDNDTEPTVPINTYFTFQSHALTHTGKVRSRNEDAILSMPEHNLWVVADGMGGHNAGDFASQCIISYLSTYTTQDSLAKCVDLIEQKIIDANEEIQKHARDIKVDKTQTSGSTVVGLFIWNTIGIIFWAGDSRIYRFNQVLQRISEDHSYVEELVKLGQISAESAEDHPAANVVLNAIGIRKELFLDLDYVTINDNDIYILCSDGLYKDIKEQDLTPIITNNHSTMELLTNTLLEHALDAGGTDNTSIISIHCQIKESVHV